MMPVKADFRSEAWQIWKLQLAKRSGRSSYNFFTCKNRELVNCYVTEWPLSPSTIK